MRIDAATRASCSVPWAANIRTHKILPRCRFQDNAVRIGRMRKETGMRGGVPRRRPGVV
jgi:hypothetical protein